MEKSNEVRVKNEPILDSHSIQETREPKIQSNKVKIEPIDNEMQTSKSQVEIKTEEKFWSSREEAVSIGFLNEETSLENNQVTTSNKQSNKHNSNVSIYKQRYTCDLCQKKFSSSSNYLNHRRTHTGEKPFECDVCQKRFKQSGNLSVHLRIHTGEKPFECGLCQKRFTQSCNLAVHLRIHTRERASECEVCKKKFRTSSYLEIHRRIHTGKKPYECELCKKRFNTLSHLIYHRKTHNR